MRPSGCTAIARIVLLNAGSPGRVQRAVGVQPCHRVTRLSTDRREVAADQQLAVGLHGDRLISLFAPASPKVASTEPWYGAARHCGACLRRLH
jgi:hypothetical protein